MSAINLNGKTALVTGASRGIGRAIALGFAAAGADVVVSARDGAALATVAKEIEKLGRQAAVIPADVLEVAAVHALVEGAIAAFGRLDIVVNNAGGTAFMVPFVNLRPSGWDKVMKLNVDSVVAVCQAVGPHLLERGTGSVINVASVAALVGTPALSPYGASKAAVLSLTRSLAMEWGHQGVRVNALCPGWTRTDLNRNLWENAEVSAGMMERVPLGRWGEAEEMVGPAVFLASDASSYLTGQAIVIDGGMTA